MKSEARHKRLEKTAVWKNREWFRNYLKSQGLDPNKHMSWFDDVYAGHGGDIDSFKFQTVEAFDEGKPHKDKWRLKSDEEGGVSRIGKKFVDRKKSDSVEDEAGKMMDDAAKKPFYGHKKRGQKESIPMKKHREKLEKDMPVKGLGKPFLKSLSEKREKQRFLKQHPDYKAAQAAGWGTKRKRALLEKLAKEESPVKPKKVEPKKIEPKPEPKKVEPKKEKDDRGFFGKLGDVLYTGDVGAWGSKKKAEEGRKAYDKAKQGHAQKEADRLGRPVTVDGYKAKPDKGDSPFAKDHPYDWDRHISKKPAPVKKPAPAPKPVKKGDRASQIRQRLKSLIRPDKKYSKEEGIEKAKLYKELASLGKPSKFGDYWIKTYLGKKPKAVEKTPLPVSVPKRDPDKLPELNVRKIIEKAGSKPVDRIKQKKAAKKAKERRELDRQFRAGKKHLRGRAKEQAAKQERELSKKEFMSGQEGPLRSKGYTAADSEFKLPQQMQTTFGFNKGGQVKKYQKDLEKEVHGMSYKGKDFLKKILKKARGGEVEKDKRDLHKEVAGMGPEGKAFLKDKLSGKKYEGKLKGKYKEDLEKELKGMSGAGRASLKKMVEPDPWKDVRKELDGAKKRNPEAKRAGESIGEMMAYSRKGYAEGGKVEITPEAKKIPKELEKASKMHKGQADRLKGMGFKHGGEMEYAKGGAVHHPVKAEPKDVLRTKKSSGMGGPVEHSKDKDWIQGAVKKPGALRAVAKKDKLIKGDEKLSGSDLSKLAKKAKEKGNKLLAKRVALAKTFAKMRKS